MSDEEVAEEKPFEVERAKSGRAKCKKCKCPIDKDQVRIAKLMANPFGEGKMKAWHHVSCIFEVFTKQRATTKRIENPQEDIGGWDALCDADKNLILEKLADFENAEPFKAAKAKAKAKSPKTNQSNKTSKNDSSVKATTSTDEQKQSANVDTTKKTKFIRDNTFLEFQSICDQVSSCSAYLEKTAIVKKMFTKGSSGGGFEGDLTLWCRLLLPGAVKRIYNLQSKALIKLFGRILQQDEDAMLEDLEQGDVAMTIKRFFESSSAVEPRATSDLTLQEVDKFLEKLSTLTKEDEQTYHFKSILNRCTADDLKMIIRLIKHDLRINAGPKHILGAVHDDAYAAFQASRDLSGIVHRFRGVSSSSPSACGPAKLPKIGKAATLALMTPVLPMLAEPCKSVEMAMQKCPNGMLSEVKYDGERVQVHKRGSSFLYFSRSLKPVLSHKVNFLKEYIPKAFPHGDDLILDSEILMVDARDGKPLPFGSLGVHKRSEFKDANVCLFVFDIIYYNGESLLNRTMKERRKLLEQKMTPIENRIMLSETQEIKDSRKLTEMIAKVFKLRLEGLVLKDVDSKYEPGKRHWLKVKKDYLFQGNMADSADLVVLGAWYGTGKKGGIMSVFLMGCHDPDQDVWLTVTKVHGGHDDATLAELQTTLDMVKIGKDPNLLPKWLKANKAMVPDFVAKDPKKQPVWEITGAEFTNQGQHTADGISIRFPRVTRIRDDKDWKTATNLPELRTLFKNSADSVDYSLLLGTQADTASGKRPLDSENESPKRKSPKKQGRSENGEASTSRADYSRAATTSSKRPLNSDDESPRKKSSEKRRRFGDEASTSKPDYSLLLGLKTDSDSSKRPVKNNSKSKQGWSRAGEASTSRRDTRMSDDERSCSGSDVNFSATTSKDIESKTNETKRLFTKKSPVKSSSKVISEYFKRSPEHTNKDELDGADVNDRSDEEGKAEFYSFIGMDYIEYSAAGSPLNWVEGRKPPKHLPKEAKPISERNEDKMRSRCLLYNTRIYLANDLDRERRQAIQRTLKTLGATVLPEVEQSRATYVIHGRSQVPSTILSEPTNVPKSARHVTESWIDATAAKSKIANAENHAVTLFGVYCSCRCPHMED